MLLWEYYWANSEEFSNSTNSSSNLYLTPILDERYIFVPDTKPIRSEE